MDSATFDLQPIEPIDHAGVIVAPAELSGLAEQEESSEPERSSAGREAGYPLAKMFVTINVLVTARAFPDAPLSPGEVKELEAAAAEVEAYYAPDLSGPWWVWARLGMTASAIYGPRLAEKRAASRATKQAAAPVVDHDQGEPVDGADPEVRL